MRALVGVGILQTETAALDIVAECCDPSTTSTLLPVSGGGLIRECLRFSDVAINLVVIVNADLLLTARGQCLLNV